jgi:hypothetical protein
MAAPTNLDFDVATPIVGFPASITQDVHDAGVTYTVYYSFVAPVTGLLSVFAFGGTGGSGYRPSILAYQGPDSSPSFLTSGGRNIPLQLQVAIGTQYFLRLTTSSGDPTPAILTLTLEFLTPAPVPIGSLLVNDDTEDFPAIALSATTDDTVLASFPDVVAGEAGDALDTGVMAFSDEYNDRLVVYTPDFTVLSSIDTSALGTPYIRTVNGTKFYVAFDGAGDVTVRDLLDTGSFGAVSLTLTGATSIKGIAANDAETILYYATAPLAQPIQRWDLVNNVALADLVAGVASLRIVDILCLPDDSIVALYVRAGSGVEEVRRYDPAGVLLTTITFSSQLPVPRLAFSVYRATFWVMSHEAGVGVYTNYALDGTVLTQVRHAAFENGAYSGAETASPPLFGASESCPLVLVRDAAPLPEEIVPTESTGGGLPMNPTGATAGCTTC